jgi:hypothetical protein
MPIKPTPLQERMKEHSGAVDWRVIRSRVVLVKLLPRRVDISREVMLKRGETCTNLTLCEGVDCDNLARCWRQYNIALR